MPPPSQRIESLISLKEIGFIVGMAYMPIILGVNDSTLEMKTTLYKLKEADLDFVIFNFADSCENGGSGCLISIVLIIFPVYLKVICLKLYV